MGQGYFTESNVGFIVYLVSLGFFVDNPSSCNVNPTAIIAAEMKFSFVLNFVPNISFSNSQLTEY